MKQQDGENFRNRESLFTEFRHSCLGRIVILAVVLGALAFIAYLTRPSEQTMREEMTDNILQCIEANDSLYMDWIDETISNVGYIFTTADTTVNQELWNTFNQYNRMEFYDHTLFTTMRIYNNYRVEGVRCAVGLFGIVIPTVNFNDFLLRTGELRKEYNQPIIQSHYGDEEYMGENPDLGGIFQYEGE